MSESSIRKALLKSAGMYAALLVMTCLVLGLVHMFARAVTLDSVRAFDFELIQASLQSRSLQLAEDRRVIEETTGVLSAVFPVAVVGPRSCVENSSRSRLCGRFPRLEDLERGIEVGLVIERYGVKTLKAEDGKHFFVGPVKGSEAWLVGEAGQYFAVGNKPLGKELAFLREIDKQLSWFGLTKMADKSWWTWWVCAALFAGLWLWNAQALTRAERRHRKLTDENSQIEHGLAEYKDRVGRLAAEQNQIEIRLESERAQSEGEIEMIMEELQSKSQQLRKVIEQRDELSLERDILADRINANRRQRKDSLKAQEIDRAFSDLHRIKKLWLTDPDWIERYQIEGTLAAESLGRAPFTESIAFVRLEWFLKTMCERKGVYDVETNEERIDALEARNLISNKDARLLHRARRARNSWFHDGAYPDRDLIERLIRFFEARNNPEVKPRI